jgi:hypothetical protein
MVFEYRVLRKIFGMNKEEVKAGWRKLHMEGLDNFHSSLSIIRIVI